MNQSMNYHRQRAFRPGILKVAGFVIGGIILAIVFAFLFGYFVMLLWNWLMPSIFGLREINYWMAFGLIVLARLLFGNMSSGHHHNHEKKKERFRSILARKKMSRCMNSDRWNQYENFWEEEGERAFDDYLERKNMDTETPAE